MQWPVVEAIPRLLDGFAHGLEPGAMPRERTDANGILLTYCQSRITVTGNSNRCGCPGIGRKPKCW